ncbi:lysophospholipid acyltransferase family protein [Leeia aquatica]|uniref:lysophospholipid acyltransferase family protein n=1 Tax=Leeia aquatica TaxID=2725557 RepID=UPI00197E8F2D|nr:lipid A biosynthesis lauroyl acyltransferase [Leeia aquatica]
MELQPIQEPDRPVHPRYRRQRLSRALILLLRGLAWLPFPLLWALAYTLGALVHLFRRGGAVDINLQMCFPEWDKATRRKVARQHYMVLARSLLELGVQVFQPKRRLLNAVTIVGMEHLRAQQGKPVILLTPHFVGMNFAGSAVAEVVPLVAMYSANKDVAFNELLLKARSRFGAPGLISRQQGLRPILKALRAGKPLYYLPDMDFGARDSVFVPFFGHPAATITAVSRIAKAADAVVVPLVVRQLGWWKGYEARFYPGWDAFPSGDEVADAVYMNQFVEARVREMPEQYFWVHRRFGTSPPGTPNRYKPARRP